MKNSVLFFATIGSFFFSMSCIFAAGTCGGPNIYLNPDFENGTTSWGVSGTCTLASSTATAQSGTKSCLVQGRGETWAGAYQDLKGKLVSGKSYCFTAWVKFKSAVTDEIVATMKKVDNAGTYTLKVAYRQCDNQKWWQITGIFDYTPTGIPSSFYIYFGTTSSLADFYIDNVSIQELSSTPNWKAEANQNIELNRKEPVNIQVLDAHGNPVHGATVRMKQISRDFAFGSCATPSGVKDTNYTNYFKSHFNWAVCENETKWATNEPQQGVYDYWGADKIYNFCSKNNIKMRGHTLFWEGETWVQDWVKNLSTNDLRTACKARIDSAATRFKNKFLHWDVNNEMLHGNFFRTRLGDTAAAWMFKQAALTDPNAQLFVNDFNILSANEYLPYYEQIKDLQSQGAPVSGIGCQGHFYTDPMISYDKLIHKLDLLAQLNLPIWMTEFDVTNTNDMVRADLLEIVYRTLYSYPSVKGILMWGFWQKAQWRANAFLVDSLWKPTEEGRRFDALLKEWTTDTILTTDTNGYAGFIPFQGKHEVTVTYPGCPGIIDTIVVPARDIYTYKPYVLIAPQYCLSCSVVPNASIPGSQVSPLIDGNKDSLWNSAVTYALSDRALTPSAPYYSGCLNSSDTNTYTPVVKLKNAATDTLSAIDFSASFAALWDYVNLYLWVSVTDDTLKSDSPNPWDDDAVEIYLDGNNEKAYAYDTNDFQFVFPWNNNTVLTQKQGTPIATPAGIQVVTKNNAEGYTMEMQIPWSAIGVAPFLGKKLGIDIHVNDDDDGNARDAKKTWIAGMDSSWRYPSLFGTIVLDTAIAPPIVTSRVEFPGNTESLYIYPNPATGMILIGLPENRPGEEVNVYDVFGRLVLHQKNTWSSGRKIHLDISMLPRGFYTLILTSGDKIYQGKFVASEE